LLGEVLRGAEQLVLVAERPVPLMGTEHVLGRLPSFSAIWAESQWVMATIGT
jgi:hypothetical protein